MLSGVSMYATARSSVALAVLWAVLCSIGSAGCDGSPGLEPPSRRDGGPSPRPGVQNPDDGAGEARDGSVNAPGGAASGGSGSSTSGAGAPAMMPPVTTPGDDDDAGS